MDRFIIRWRLYIIALLGAIVTANQQYPVVPAAYLIYVCAALSFFTAFVPPLGQKIATVADHFAPSNATSIEIKPVSAPAGFQRTEIPLRGPRP